MIDLITYLIGLISFIIGCVWLGFGSGMGTSVYTIMFKEKIDEWLKKIKDNRHRIKELKFNSERW